MITEKLLDDLKTLAIYVVGHLIFWNIIAAICTIPICLASASTEPFYVGWVFGCLAGIACGIWHMIAVAEGW